MLDQETLYPLSERLGLVKPRLAELLLGLGGEIVHQVQAEYKEIL